MSRLQIEALLAESGDELDAVDRTHVGDELGALLGLVDDAPPAPSAALEALLATGPARDTAAVAPTRLADRRLTGARGAVTGAVVLAVATVGATGLSAAANSLPAPLQRKAADLSRTYLPFDFPQPRTELDHDLGLGLPRPERGGTVADDAAEQDARVPLSSRPEARPPAATAPATDDVRRGSTPATDVPRPERSSDPTSERSTPSTGRARTDASADVGETPDRREDPGDAVRSRGDRGGSPRPSTTTSSSPSGAESVDQPPGLVIASPMTQPVAAGQDHAPQQKGRSQGGQGQGQGGQGTNEPSTSEQDEDQQGNGQQGNGQQGNGQDRGRKAGPKDLATDARGRVQDVTSRQRGAAPSDEAVARRVEAAAGSPDVG